jgi:hypothetical protein
MAGVANGYDKDWREIFGRDQRGSSTHRGGRLENERLRFGLTSEALSDFASSGYRGIVGVLATLMDPQR